MQATLPVLGIDTSKATLDVYLPAAKQRGHQRIANTTAGYEQLHQWLKQQGIEQVHACLEATGCYSHGISQYLYEQGHQVSVVNPARVSAFRESEGIRSKTDKQDARLLALFCTQKHPALWKPVPTELQELQSLMGRLDDLKGMQRQEQNRLENSRLDAYSRQQITGHLAWLAQQMKQFEAHLQTVVTHQKEIQQICQRLDSVPGMAMKTAMRVLSVLVDVTRFDSASQVAAYLGVIPAEKTSGTSVRGRAKLDKMGHAQGRKWLSMCALVVLRTDPDFRQWGEELRARGKCWKVIHVAVMRKLAHIIFGVLKSDQPYDPKKAFPSHYATQKPVAEQTSSGDLAA
jgi:transposase